MDVQEAIPSVAKPPGAGSVPAKIHTQSWYDPTMRMPLVIAAGDVTASRFRQNAGS